ncbi:Vms1/Ankzf1 family peptidyl-tRNA hydrolase [Nocardia cyriacigeorgica]|uniref:Rv2629 family ribosome hibernation factor n=1 Tax=Nocardia cyriacigeorgica TaxID=135487 RepID=UPI0002FF6CB2|nr:Vms1/Ankzf1 family peptidyl-tRNA hydrolase [Nocardia cyriacigeorgica]MBF6496611.1 hypothetical protein [Nocardia cyriacigeorgica]TLF58688.1 peptide chain release factor 2 [Nocardia cyriacigeorgica]
MDIRQIAQRAGPFASVYIDGSHDTEDAAHQTELRWRSARGQLADQGAPTATLERLDTAIAQRHPGQGRCGRLLIADDDEVLVDEFLPDPPPREELRVSPRPYLLPLLAHDAEQTPHVVAVVDSVGCDVRAVDEHGHAMAEAVEGQDHPVHKVPGGGWSHLSMQRRTEETVRRNVDEVAREVSALADRVRAEVVVLAGEVSARSALHDALPDHGATVVEVESGGRAEGTDDAEFEARVHEMIAEQARAHRTEALERLTAERARDDGLAVAGLADTVAALRMANVAQLLIEAPSSARHSVWVGADPAQVSLRRDELDSASAEQCPADAALPVAALAVGAEVVAVDGAGLPDGVAALLRHR